MQSVLRSQIADCLRAMEQGAFQDFCLDYLPLFSATYNGLVRHGATAEGKTRKGTPDLIKTSSNGRQVAVQCSVEGRYWRAPKSKADYSKWKPCADIDKCIEALRNLDQIVLCSNQEIPTTSPNAKVAILDYARAKTPATIVLIHGVDIETNLYQNMGNLEYGVLFKNHLPSIFHQLELQKEAQTYRLAVELTNERPARLEDIIKIVRDAIGKFTEEGEVRSYALKQIDTLRSRFERSQLPPPSPIIRKVPPGSPLLTPIGKVVSLVGVPKIGKTSLVAQCTSYWEGKGFKVRWFECPIDHSASAAFSEDLSRNIWACFGLTEGASDLAKGILQSHSLLIISFNHTPTKLMQ